MKLKYSLFFLFSILLTSFSIQNVNAVYVYDGYIEYWDWILPKPFYVYHSSTYSNSTILYFSCNNSYFELGAYSLRNFQFINLTLYCWMDSNDDYADPDANLDIHIEILVNLAPTYTIDDNLVERSIPPMTADSFSIFTDEMGIEDRITERYLVMNFTSECNANDIDFKIGFEGYFWFRAEYYDILNNSLSLAFVKFIPTFLLVLLFPSILYSYNKKYGIVIGLFIGAFILSFTGLIDTQLTILLFIGSGLMGYYYIKNQKEEF